MYIVLLRGVVQFVTGEWCPVMVGLLDLIRAVWVGV